MKKNGTATRAIMRVSIKSPASLKDERGEVCMATINKAAMNLKQSIPV